MVRSGLFLFESQFYLWSMAVFALLMRIRG
jgi:hypothetical protein